MRNAEEQLLPLGQVLARDALSEFAGALRSELDALLKWRSNGILTVGEGRIFDTVEALARDDKLTAAAIERVNKEYEVYAESAEFKTTLYGQMLSEEEECVPARAAEDEG